MSNQNKLSDPLSHILNCCDRNIMPTKFDILNARDQLRKIKDQLENLISCYSETINMSKEDHARWLSSEQDRAKLSEENKLLKESLNNAVAWARINERGDLYDLRLFSNPYIDETTTLPLYSNREEMKKLTDKLKERLTS